MHIAPYNRITNRVLQALAPKELEHLLSQSDPVTLTYGDHPVEWRRGLCTMKRHHYVNELG